MSEGKRGRKPWVPTPEILQKIEGYAGRFLQEQQIARLVGIHPNDFSTKKKSYPELSEAIEAGRAKAGAIIGDSLFSLVKKQNVPTSLFLAKSVLGLRDTDPMIQENVTLNVYAGDRKDKFDF
jgi:hypothetical protein